MLKGILDIVFSLFYHIANIFELYNVNGSSNLRIQNFLKTGSVCAINLHLSINRTAFFKFK